MTKATTKPLANTVSRKTAPAGVIASQAAAAEARNEESHAHDALSALSERAFWMSWRDMQSQIASVLRAGAVYAEVAAAQGYEIPSDIRNSTIWNMCSMVVNGKIAIELAPMIIGKPGLTRNLVAFSIDAQKTLAASGGKVSVRTAAGTKMMHISSLTGAQQNSVIDAANGRFRPVDEQALPTSIKTETADTSSVTMALPTELAGWAKNAAALSGTDLGKLVETLLTNYRMQLKRGAGNA